jgi:hypothetical protein
MADPGGKLDHRFLIPFTMNLFGSDVLFHLSGPYSDVLGYYQLTIFHIGPSQVFLSVLPEGEVNNFARRRELPPDWLTQLCSENSESSSHSCRSTVP